jgi:ribosomal protein S12 methylthiotransferase accessory factor YcaO
MSLNDLTLDQLFEHWGITRVGAVDGLDTIGLPVWSACRPLGKAISISAGRGATVEIARAGAIGEAIEHHTFENPLGDFQMKTISDFAHLPMAKEFDGKPKIVAVEFVTHWPSGNPILLPSDLFWLVGRGDKLNIFQRSSTGQAVAISKERAFISGLYECIERDAMTIRIATINEFNILPPALKLIPSPVSDLIHKAGLKLLLFYCTLEIPVPVVWAVLADPSGEQTAYSGYGTDLDLFKAQQKAITEAVQSRAIYIAGARDDLNWSLIERMRATGHKSLIEEYATSPKFEPERVQPKWETAELLQCLGGWAQNIFVKMIMLPFGLHAVKTIIIGLEPFYTEHWKGGNRWERFRQFFSSGRASTTGSMILNT